MCSVVWVRTTQTHKKKIIDMNTDGSCHRPLALDFFLLSLRTRLRQDCSLIFLWSLSIVDQFWSFFFFFLNKSVLRQICVKLEVGLDVCIVVSTEFCKFVYTKFTSPIRLLFFSFPPFHSFKWDTLILFFHFFPPFPSIFHVRVCHKVTARWLPERAHGTQHLCR